jgi:hypothetical protein
MRRLVLHAVSALIAPIAIVSVLLLGAGGQARAGMITVEMLAAPGDFATLPDYWAVEQDTPACACVMAADPLSERAFDEAPVDGAHRSRAALARFGVRAPAVPVKRSASLTKGTGSQALWIVDRPEHAPAGSASLLLITSRTQSPDPCLSGLFRPPRCS